MCGSEPKQYRILTCCSFCNPTQKVAEDSTGISLEGRETEMERDKERKKEIEWEKGCEHKTQNLLNVKLKKIASEGFGFSLAENAESIKNPKHAKCQTFRTKISKEGVGIIWTTNQEGCWVGLLNSKFPSRGWIKDWMGGSGPLTKILDQWMQNWQNTGAGDGKSCIKRADLLEHCQEWINDNWLAANGRFCRSFVPLHTSQGKIHIRRESERGERAR